MSNKWLDKITKQSKKSPGGRYLRKSNHGSSKGYTQLQSSLPYFNGKSGKKCDHCT
jgi:hypothetical protein